MLDLRRRQFITLLGGAAAAWPLAASAQQSARLRTIGFLGPNTHSAASEWLAALVQRLRELGWLEGRNITIEYRWAEGREERYAEIAAELVRLKPDVIVTSGTQGVVALKQSTSVIPIIFATAGDPVASGLVASLARPAGNATGLATLANELAGKRLELLREVVPALRRLAIMGNVANPYMTGVRRGPGGGAHARSRSCHAGNPTSAGSRARLRGAQKPRGRALCLYRRAH
jgi:putative ABC transport system substrate-binding protein